jgi:UDP-glucose 4-epimerase
MRIVVTGAKGFIGSVFSLRATEHGHDVIALDDGSRGLNPTEDRIGSAFRQFDCLHGIKDAVEGSIDAVVHLAAATGSLERPLEELLEYNVGMTQHVYNDALSLGARAFVWPTTSLALGVPDSPYVVSKERALTWLRQVDGAADGGAGIGIPVRFFNVAGAYKGLTEYRKNEVHLLPMLLEHQKRGEPVIINGDDYNTIDGTPSRDFVHVYDVVEYLLALIEGKVGGMLPVVPHAGDGAVWLGTSNSTTVLQALSIFEQFAGCIDKRIGPRRAYDCGALYVDSAQSLQFEGTRRGLTPVWVSIRDEIEAIKNTPRYREERFVDEHGPLAAGTQRVNVIESDP